MDLEHPAPDAPAPSTRPRERLAALNHAALQINSRLSRPEIFRELVQSAVELADASAGAWGEFLDGQMVFTEYWKLGAGWTQIAYRFDPYYGVPGWVMMHRAPYLSNDAEHDPQVPPHIREQVGFHNLIDLPIINRDGVLLGCFELHDKVGGGRFNREDAEVLAGLAAFAAVALENAALLRRTEQAVRQRDDFLGMAAHELRTPLTSLQLNLESLQRARPDEPAERRAAKLRSAASQVRRLTRLVERLLEVSLVREGRLAVERRPGDLAALLRKVLEGFAARFENAGCEVDVEAPRVLEASFDSARLEEALESLFSNAAKFGAGAPVRVRLVRRNGFALFEVADRGPGIEPESLREVFEPLSRAASPEHYGGLGLGLFVARAIVEAHRGRIRVQSTVGKGTRVFVELPLE